MTVGGLDDKAEKTRRLGLVTACQIDGVIILANCADPLDRKSAPIDRPPRHRPPPAWELRPSGRIVGAKSSEPARTKVTLDWSGQKAMM